MATTTAPTGFGRPIWSAIKGGNQVHGVGLSAVTNCFEGKDDTFSRVLFTAPASAAGGFWKIDAATIVPTTTIAANGSNKWKFKLQVATLNVAGTSVATTDLGDAEYTTDTAIAMTAGLPVTLDVDGPENASPKLTYLAPGDSIFLLATKVNSGVDQSANYFTVTLFMRNSPPGR